MRLIFLLCITSLIVACPRLFPERVASGVARLSVANLGLLLMGLKQVKHENLECDLFSPTQTNDAIVEGNSFSIGSVTWKFNNCTFDFGEGIDVKDRENIVQGRISGKTTLSGTKTLSGYLTGDPNFPVIPQGGNSLNFAFSRVEFDHFKAQLPNIKETLTNINGDLRFSAAIHLARDEKHGLCTLPIANITIDHVMYNSSRHPKGTLVRLDSAYGQTDVELDHSDFSAQQGRYAERENELHGYISLWNNKVRVPSDRLGLSPSYDPRASDENPPSYLCPVDQFVATNAARLVIQNTGSVAQKIALDRRCGLSASRWIKPFTKNNLSIPIKNCRLISSPNEVFAKNCQDALSFIDGSLNVDIKTFLKGEIQTNCFGLFTDIAPWEPESIRMELEKVVFDEYATWTTLPDAQYPLAKLSIHSGTLKGQFTPVMTSAKGSDCNFSAATPIASFENIELKEAKISMAFNLKGILGPDDLILNLKGLEIQNSSLRARNGFYQGRGNYVAGNITLNGKKFELSDTLNPSYSQEEFDNTYRCLLDCDPTNDHLKCYTQIADLISHESGWNPRSHCQE